MIRLILMLTLLCMGLLPTAAQDDDDIDPEFEDAIITIARQVVTDLTVNEYQAVFGRFSEDMADALPIETLQVNWEGVVQQAGAYQEEISVNTLIPAGAPAGSVTVILTAQFENEPLDLSITFSSDQEIIGFFIRPASATVDADFEAEAVTLARQIIDALNAGDYQPVVDRFTADVAAALPVDTLQSTWETVNAQAGAYVEELAVHTLDPTGPVPEGSIVVVVTAQFENIVLDLTFTVTPEQEIAGFFIAAGQDPDVEAPDYVDVDAFTEEDVVIGEDTAFSLPGTLAMPAGDGPFPAVIILGGSGPTDRDGTIGPNTPLRDIAQGLASQGIATLRFDKRTTVPAYAQQFANSPENANLQTEYIDDALAAIDLLKATDGIDADRIFIAGHSLGGTATPRVAAQAGEDVAGMIILAGSAAPLSDAVLRQITYLSELDGVINEQEQANLDAIEQAVAEINSPEGDIALDANLLGAPYSYWLDIKGNPPADVAAELDLPMLILQGERDYQVTLEDDLVLWEAAVGDRDNVSVMTYEGLGHIFTPASDPATPADYEIRYPVDAAVIADIVTWVNEQ